MASPLAGWRRRFGRVADALPRLLRRIGLLPAVAPDQWLDGHFEHQHRSVDYKLFVPGRGAGRPRPCC